MVGSQTLACGDFRIVLSKSTIEEAEAAPPSQRLPLGPESRFVTYGVVKVETARDEAHSWQRYLYEPGGSASVDGRSALCREGQLFAIVGRRVVCLSLAMGALNWACEGDDSACFGVYQTPDADALIVHGELQIARVSLAGVIEWRCWGRDIYRIAYETGHSAIIGHDKPFPH